MRLVITIALLFLWGGGVGGQYTVVNNCPAGVEYKVVNKIKVEERGVNDSDTLRTVSGRLLKLTANGYVYADETPGVVSPVPFVPRGSTPPTPVLLAERVNTSYPGSTGTAPTPTPVRGVLRLGPTSSGQACLTGG